MDASAIAKPHDRLAQYLADDLEAVNSLIRTKMASEHAPRIPEVTQHLVEAGGKRLRPMLTLAAARMCGYDGPFHVHLAATVEFIHTATLLHDDVVDESAQRRGRPTANLLWDNKSSVLVGDYLFSRSFQLMTETGNMDVLRILSEASATIAEGEVLQLSAANNLETSMNDYIEIITSKTAALFAAACEVGPVLANAPKEQAQAMYDYGLYLGIAFQIADDALDYSADRETLGKVIGDDFREGKVTAPILFALEDASAEEKEFWNRTINQNQQNDDDLAKAQSILDKHDCINKSLNLAQNYAERASVALKKTPESELSSLLNALISYIIFRKA